MNKSVQNFLIRFILFNSNYFCLAQSINENIIQWLDTRSNYVKIDDILFPKDFLTDSKNSKNRGAFRDERLRWPGGIVVYYLDPVFDNFEKDVILGAFYEISSETCIRFRPWTPSDSDFVHVKSDATGCWSYHGRQKGGQVLNLGPECIKQGIVIHEILHALGFVHEQSRPDRDDWIDIDWSNIEAGNEHNFDKFSPAQVDTLGVPYDYGSIMHYSRSSFAANSKRPVITPSGSGPFICYESWQCPQHLSRRDVWRINRLYENVCWRPPRWQLIQKLQSKSIEQKFKLLN